MIVLDSYMLGIIAGALGVVVATAPLGCIVVWRRMAYFGDATAHVALLGVALALTLHMNVFWPVIAAAMAMGHLVFTLAARGQSFDSILGVLSHGALAFGLVAIAAQPDMRVDLTAILLGDVLAIGWPDVWVIWGGAALVGVLLALNWGALLTVTLSPELAAASGVSLARQRWVMTVTLSVVVAIGLQLVGALLIGGLMLVTAAAARPLARTPEQMVAGAVAVGVTSVLVGLELSFLSDIPTGPMIVCVAAVIYALTQITSLILRR